MSKAITDDSPFLAMYCTPCIFPDDILLQRYPGWNRVMPALDIASRPSSVLPNMGLNEQIFVHGIIHWAKQARHVSAYGWKKTTAPGDLPDNLAQPTSPQQHFRSSFSRLSVREPSQARLHMRHAGLAKGERPCFPDMVMPLPEWQNESEAIPLIPLASSPPLFTMPDRHQGIYYSSRQKQSNCPFSLYRACALYRQVPNIRRQVVAIFNGDDHVIAIVAKQSP